MASEILAVPEEDLAGVIDVIRAGLGTAHKVKPSVKKNLLKWCKEEEEYLKRLQED